MSAMVIPALRNLDDIQSDKDALSDCIRRVKALELRSGFTARSQANQPMPIHEARQRLQILQERIELLTSDT